MKIFAMVCLTPSLSNEQSVDDFTNEDRSELNEIIANDESEGINGSYHDLPDNQDQRIDMMNTYLDMVYFAAMTSEQVKCLVESAYNDTNPSALSSIIDPIAFYFNITSDSVKNSFIDLHKALRRELYNESL